MNLLISAALCLPALAAILAIGVWVCVDHVAEARRHTPSEPLISGGRLVPEGTGQVIAIGRAPVPPRSHRRTSSGWPL